MAYRAYAHLYLRSCFGDLADIDPDIFPVAVFASQLRYVRFL